MKHKQTFLMKGSFALLLFVILGYLVRFYPEQLAPIDSQLQEAVRGELPDFLTLFFQQVTRLFDPIILVSWVLLFSIRFYMNQWKMESLLLFGNLLLTGSLVLVLKHVYQRPRPDILHLVSETGYSFPSGHSLAATFMLGSLLVVVTQRMKHPLFKKGFQCFLILLWLGILLSRVYLGVHYPSDVLGSLCLGLGILWLEYPFYDKFRFQCRFQGKQK